MRDPEFRSTGSGQPVANFSIADNRRWRDQEWQETTYVDVAVHLRCALERRLLPGQSVWSADDIVIASVDHLKTRPETVLSHSSDVVVIIARLPVCQTPHSPRVPPTRYGPGFSSPRPPGVLVTCFF